MGCPRPQTARSNPYDLGELEKDLRDRLYTLFHDAPSRGLTLVSGYRDPGRQWDLRTPDRGIPAGQQCNPAYKGRPATAVPATWNGSEWVGGSKHQHRKAADIGGRDLQWAIDNRARYGLGLTVRSENWHNEAHGTDARTGRPIPAPSVRILTYPGPSWDDATTKDWFDMATEADLARVVDERLTVALKPIKEGVADIHKETVQSIPPNKAKGIKASARWLIGKIAKGEKVS